jgi:hypothetical protein
VLAEHFTRGLGSRIDGIDDMNTTFVASLLEVTFATTTGVHLSLHNILTTSSEILKKRRKKKKN